MTEFLTYELLTPETADPVVMKITGQRGKKFNPFKASNGVQIHSLGSPEYCAPGEGAPWLWVRGSNRLADKRDIEIPLADWPAVKQAIRELNEYYKEKKMKEDRYEFPLGEWQYTTEPEPFELPTPTKLIVTRKKPKVKVEYQSCGWSEWREPDGDYGEYHIVQFRVTGFGWKEGVALYGRPDYYAVIFVGDCPSSLNTSRCPKGFFNLLIGIDARDKWSTPVLLPESIYSKLDEICRALESKANEVKG